MATISENLQTLQTAKQNIKSAIEAKGQDLTNVPFTEYADKISAIQGGGGTGTDRLQWKCDNMKSLAYEFYNYKGTDLSILDGLDTSQVNDVSSVFSGCSNLTTIPQINISNVTNLTAAFSKCTKLTNLPQLDTSSVTIMRNMCYEDSNLTEFPSFNFENVEDLYYGFYGCRKLKTIKNVVFKKPVNLYQAFGQCYILEDVEMYLDGVTDIQYMFYQAAHGSQGADATIKLYNTHNVTNMNYTFNQSYNLVDVYIEDTSKVTSFNSTFYGSKITLTELNTDSATTMAYCFNGCPITSMKLSNTSKVTSFSYTFSGCSRLVTLDGINMISCTSNSSMLNNCKALENLTIKNIKINLTIGSGTSYGHLLTNASLLNTAQELWDNTSNALGGTRTLTMSTPSKTNIRSIYVKLVDITDEMIANDQYISNKKPCVECASTDDGAMTLEEYIISKNWSIG